MKFTGIAVAAVLAVGGTGAASAATLSLVGDYANDYVVTGNDFGYNGKLDYISGLAKDDTNGLFLSGPATVTYTYLGKEAGNTNYAKDASGEFFTTASVAGATHVVTQLVAGLLEFSLGTSAPLSAIGVIDNNGFALPASINYAIAFQKLTETSYVVLFDDVAAGDRDFDDLVLRVDIQPVPIPAAGLLLVGALGGLAAVRRRKA